MLLLLMPSRANMLTRSSDQTIELLCLWPAPCGELHCFMEASHSALRHCVSPSHLPRWKSPTTGPQEHLLNCIIAKIIVYLERFPRPCAAGVSFRQIHSWVWSFCRGFIKSCCYRNIKLKCACSWLFETLQPGAPSIRPLTWQRPVRGPVGTVLNTFSGNGS